MLCPTEPFPASLCCTRNSWVSKWQVQVGCLPDGESSKRKTWIGLYYVILGGMLGTQRLGKQYYAYDYERLAGYILK